MSKYHLNTLLMHNSMSLASHVMNTPLFASNFLPYVTFDQKQIEIKLLLQL